MTTADKNTIIRNFMGDQSVYLIMPFTYELGEVGIFSGEKITTENAEDEVRAELEEGAINSVDACIYLKEYHNDWGLLMEVVDGIMNACIPHTTDNPVNLKRVEVFKNVSIYSSKEVVYKAVVQFIEWYNQQPK